MLNIRSRRLALIKPVNDAQATHLAGRILDHARRRYEKYRDGLDRFEDHGMFINNPTWTPAANSWVIRLQRLGIRYYEHMLLDVMDDLDAAEAYGINLQAAFPRSGKLVRELDFAINHCHRRLNELDYCLALSRT